MAERQLAAGGGYLPTVQAEPEGGKPADRAGTALSGPVGFGKMSLVFTAEEPMSADLQSLEQRVATLERLVDELRTRPAPVENVGLDWKQWAVADEAGIEEITRIGREYRLTGRVPEADGQP
jgi:hypothetical protein